ncbi:MAG: aminotransferase class I/II-fold pyridoxal phosphate-dependent enzyme, partial [Bacteroidota bacterium]
AGDKEIIDYLMYNMRSQIFAKSLPMPMVVGGIKRLELLKKEKSLRKNLWQVVHQLQEGLRAKGFNLGNTESPVTPVILKGGVPEATQITYDLRENYGIFCSIVAYPVVPKDIIMLRVIPTAIHTFEDVNRTIEAFSEVKEKLNNGEYLKEMAEMNLSKFV